MTEPQPEILSATLEEAPKPIPLRTPAEFAEKWVNDAVARAEDPNRPEATAQLRQERFALFARQVIHAYDIPVNEQGEVISPEDNAKVAHRLRLLGVLAMPQASVDQVDRARALSFADDLARLVWKDAYNEHEIRQVQEAMQQAWQQAELESHEATHDYLTGLLNRRGLVEAFTLLTEAVANSEYEGIALLLGDLDGFKPVNDRLGHDVGDEVLVQVAEHLNTSTRKIRVPGMREPDVVVRVRAKDEPEGMPEGAPEAENFRVGGDEFAVLAPITKQPLSKGKTPPKKPLTPYMRAKRMGARLEASLRRKVFRTSRGEVSNIGITFGVAVWKPGMSLNELVRQADVKMYQAKRKKKQKR